MYIIKDNHSGKRSFLTLFSISIYIFVNLLNAQPQIDLPKEIFLEVNGSEIPLTSGWIDTLVEDALAGMIYYKIVGAKRSQYYVTTVLQIPQIFTVNDVLRQIVLYYALLPNEDTRESEVLSIYPYFTSIAENPAIKAQYSSEGDYDIRLSYWDKVPIPDQPIPEEKYIFNQILQTSFSGVQSIGDVPENVFEEVAIKTRRSVEEIKIIYQNTILWQVGSQIRHE